MGSPLSACGLSHAEVGTSFGVDHRRRTNARMSSQGWRGTTQTAGRRERHWRSKNCGLPRWGRYRGVGKQGEERACYHLGWRQLACGQAHDQKDEGHCAPSFVEPLFVYCLRSEFEPLLGRPDDEGLWSCACPTCPFATFSARLDEPDTQIRRRWRRWARTASRRAHHGQEHDFACRSFLRACGSCVSCARDPCARWSTHPSPAQLAGSTCGPGSTPDLA